MQKKPWANVGLRGVDSLELRGGIRSLLLGGPYIPSATACIVLFSIA